MKKENTFSAVLIVLVVASALCGAVAGQYIARVQDSAMSKCQISLSFEVCFEQLNR